MPSDRGYVLFWRKTWDSKILKDPGHTFSRREAWIYLFTNLAQGIDRNGVGRGEFRASIRYLAQSWNWSKSKVERFIAELIENNMLIDTGKKSVDETRQKVRHFIVCNYDTYQKPWDTSSNSEMPRKPRAARLGHLSGHLSGHLTNCECEECGNIRDTSRDTSRDVSNKGVNEREKKRHISTPIPTDFTVTDEMRLWAKEKCPLLSIEMETENWRDYHKAKGSTFKDWTAAWHTWFRNGQKWAVEREAKQNSQLQESGDDYDQRMAERGRRIRERGPHS